MPGRDGGHDWNRDGVVGPVEGLVGSRRDFARDVFVNVLTNLVAGAILYVSGVAFGLLPRSRPALFVGFAVMGSFAVAGLIRSQGSGQTDRRSWIWEATCLYSASCYALALFCFPGMPEFIRWFCYFGVGSGLLLAGDTFYGWIERRFRARRSRASSGVTRHRPSPEPPQSRTAVKVSVGDTATKTVRPRWPIRELSTVWQKLQDASGGQGLRPYDPAQPPAAGGYPPLDPGDSGMP